jgi:hypothetical protein
LVVVGHDEYGLIVEMMYELEEGGAGATDVRDIFCCMVNV